MPASISHPCTQHSSSQTTPQATLANLLTPSQTQTYPVPTFSDARYVPNQIHLYMHGFLQAYPGLFLIFTLKNRSHTLNPGDQFINLGLRRMVRSRSKTRIARFFLDLQVHPLPLLFSLLPPLPPQEGKIPVGTPLPMGEHTLKPLIITWCGEWLAQPDLTRDVSGSWDRVMKEVDVPAAEVEGPPASLCLPSGPASLAPLAPAAEIPDSESDDELNLNLTGLMPQVATSSRAAQSGPGMPPVEVVEGQREDEDDVAQQCAMDEALAQAMARNTRIKRPRKP